MRRTTMGIVLIVATVLAGAGYVGWRMTQAEATTPLVWGDGVFYVDSERVRQMGAEGVGPSCRRAYAAAGTLVCLRTGIAADATKVVVYDREFRETLSLSQWGTPSRAKVSPSGRLIAWTVFRTGDSYLAPGGGFSTTAGAYDLKTGTYYGSLEDFTTVIDGKVLEAADRNYWGITFAADDNTFYATVGSGGKTWLLKGDLGNRRMESIRQNAECPSLSPDGQRLVYKVRTGDRWRLHVFDLRTGTDIALAEADHVDDQAAWLDDNTVAYAKNMAIFTVTADGSGAPKRLVSGSSPSRG